MLYEGYGPAGVAVLVEALTDNRNRASAEIRHAFSTHGGGLGEPGSVAWNFEKKGVVVLDGDRYSEDDVMPAIDAGAEDVQEEGDKMRILSEPTDLTAVKAALEEAGVEIESATLATEPKSTVELTGKDAQRMIDLLEVLDDQDDVDQVYANFDIPDVGDGGARGLSGWRGRPLSRPAPAVLDAVLGVSWRSWLAVTAMRRPGREGVEGFATGSGGGRTYVQGACGRRHTCLQFRDGDAGNVTLPCAFGRLSRPGSGPENALQLLPSL